MSLPVAILYEERLAHNVDWMQRFVAAYDVQLCPHGKTTMAPRLFHRQLDAGAWGITLATARQVRVAYFNGVRRVLMANQLVGQQNMALIAELLDDPGFEFYCLVDSPENVDTLGAFFTVTRLNVLLEIGAEGGRSGIRGFDQVAPILEALARHPNLRLRGIELFEGVVPDEAAVRRLLDRAVETAKQIPFEGDSFILSGAGSEWFDVVAEVFTTARFDLPAEVVLRPGCYLTHDIGLYKEPAARMKVENAVVRDLGVGLLPALQVWAYVQSLPEPGVAIVGMGKRDASYDAGLPVPVWHFRPGWSEPRDAHSAWQVVRMMDQHAILQVGQTDDLKVGDMLGFDISHPCLTFDKWRFLPVVDAEFNVIEVIETFFRPA